MPKRRYTQRIISPTNRHEAVRILVLAIIQTAQLDAIGHIESSSYSQGTLLREETIKDAASFFNGPRYAHYAAHVDVSPEILPLAIQEVLNEIDLSNYDDDHFSKRMVLRQRKQIKTFERQRHIRKLKHSLERLAKKQEEEARCPAY
ncbi:MAG: hypothetical protein DRI46_10310 [Chloroflexi bacterium]|nr:MAG: hypothetical protein DRI46_10310 [Chloroflexota bacterium]